MDIDAWLEREGRVPFRVVENWRAEVDSLQPIAAGILTDFALHKRCLVGRCPHCILRLKLSRPVRYCKLDIQKLSEVGKSQSLSGQFGESPPPPISEDRPVGKVVGEAIDDAQCQIEAWLKEENGRCRVIGVYGMGGVGKTTLLKNINNGALAPTLVEVVIWVTVSQNPNAKEMQNSIAQRLGFGLPENSSTEERGARVCRSLKDKRFLIILDDMWSGIDAEDLLGVSSTEGRGKILLSTRNLEVCASMIWGQLKASPKKLLRGVMGCRWL